MMYSVLSGDIVSYTALNTENRGVLTERLSAFLGQLETRFDTFGRIIKGDYLECVVPDASEGLAVALAIKAFVKSLPIEEEKDAPRFRWFKTYGIRIAIGYGELSQYIPEKGIIDGSAIYLSGRKISGLTTYDKERVTIKNTLYFTSSDTDLNDGVEPIMNLLDVLLAKATARQCEVLYLKLLGFTEAEVASQLGIGQSAVNQHSTSMGWNAIESAVQYFKKVISKRK